MNRCRLWTELQGESIDGAMIQDVVPQVYPEAYE